MSSIIKLDYRLKISKERGFPEGLNLEAHIQSLANSAAFIDSVLGFWNDGEILYNRPPARVFLVEEMPGGKWLYWGNALIFDQTITKNKTNGKYCIKKIYLPNFQRQITIEESPPGKSYFEEKPTSLLSLHV